MNEPDTAKPRRLREPWRAALTTLGIELCLAVAAGLTFALVTVPPTPAGVNERFTASPEYLVWRGIITLMVLTALVGAGVAVATLRGLRNRYRRTHLVSLSLAYVPAMLAVVTLQAVANDLKKFSWSMLGARNLVVLVAIGVAGFPVVGLLWFVRGRLVVLGSPPHPAPATRIRELLELRRVSTTALGFLAAVISLTVIATGQLRLTNIAAGADPKDLPIAAAIMYGVFFAVILALIYVPVEVRWRRVAADLRDALYRVPVNGRLDAAWSDGRARLTDLLALDVKVAGSLGATLTVLSPFLVSLLGYFLPGPKG